MSIWSKIGKIGLQAAPYVAAPFTGGASLAFAPAARQAGNMWAQHDANEAAKKGLGPSSFDNILGKVSNYAGMANEMGLFDKFGGGSDARRESEGINRRVAGGSILDQLSGNGGILSSILNSRGGRSSPSIIMDDPREGGLSGNMGRGQNFPGAGQSRGGQTGIYSGIMRGLGPVMGRRDQNVPNFAESIGAGRQDAIRNQPFRQGYDVISYGPEPADDAEGNIGPEIRTHMPPIYPTGSSPRRRRTYGTGAVQ